MKRFWLCCAGLFVAHLLRAQIDGPYSGNSVTISPIPGSSNTWTNPSGALGSDNVYATTGSIASVGQYTDYLVITDFQFAIPPGSIISGIVVDIERSDFTRRTSDYSIRIVKNGVIGTSEHASGTGYRAADSYQSFGSSGDLWGETWTDADINSTGFGVAIAAQRSVGGSLPTSGKIDDVQITIFYNFVVTPLRLISFTGTKKDNSVELAWETEAEVNMNYYEVQRSTDGTSFSPIGIIKSNNYTSAFTYSYTDRNLPGGTLYYRLKMVGNAQNDISFSRIVTIGNATGSELSVFPNPLKTGDDLYINNSSGEQLNIQFYNINGQQLGNLNTNSTIINTNRIALQKGVLIYRIADKNQKLIKTGRLVVQ